MQGFLLCGEGVELSLSVSGGIIKTNENTKNLGNSLKGTSKQFQASAAAGVEWSWNAEYLKIGGSLGYGGGGTYMHTYSLPLGNVFNCELSNLKEVTEE
jgi:hypothetical protein